MQLGTVSYLNAIPLTVGLPHPLLKTTPRELLRELKAGNIDMALLSTVALFENPGLYLVPGMGIGCRGPVASVKVFFNKPCISIYNLKSFKPSPESNTANILARLLLPSFSDRYLTGVADAEVVIGDAALTRADPYGSVDLGEWWVKRTGLPFVFAAWISRHPVIPRDLYDALCATRQRNLADLPACLDAASLPLPLPRDHQLHYLSTHVHYQLGDQELAGLACFREQCQMAGIIPHPYEIRFVEFTS